MELGEEVNEMEDKKWEQGSRKIYINWRIFRIIEKGNFCPSTPVTLCIKILSKLCISYICFKVKNLRLFNGTQNIHSYLAS